MLSKINLGRISLAASISALALVAATPAVAGDRCELNGTSLFGGANATGSASLACGGLASANADASTAVGALSTAAVENSTAVGYGAHAINTSSSPYFSSRYFDLLGSSGSTAVGTAATAIGTSSTAFGFRALVGFVVDPATGEIEPVDHGTAIGSNASVVGDFSTSVGSGALGDRGTAIGYNAFAIAPGLGPQNDFAVAIGNGARATDVGAVSVGAASNAGGAGAYAVGIGASSTASGDESIAIGGAGSLGSAATAATATGSIAIGAGAKSTHANSIALGADTATTAENQVHVGGRTISGVAAGVNATDAVNVSQLQAVTGDVSGLQSDVTVLETTTATHTAQITNLQTGLADTNADVAVLQTDLAAETAARIAADSALDGRVDALETITANLDERFDDVADRSDAGTAAAVALSGAMFLPGKSFNLTGNVGAYRGAVAGAIQLGALVSDMVALNAGVAHGFNKGGKTAIRAGFTLGW